MSPAAGARPRCFVALRPDEATRAALVALARRWHRALPQARPTAPGNLHLTLAFIGALDEPRASALARALAEESWPTLHWIVDRADCFPGARVAWAGGPPDEALERLVAAVRRLLDAQGVAYDRQAFSPHITLLRGVRALPPASAFAPIAWTSTSPVLLESTRDARGALRYRPWRRLARA